MLSAQIHSPFPDRSERAGTGHDRAHRDGEHPRQRIAHTSRVARIRNLAQHAQQGVIDVVEAGRGDRGRWHERVWSLSETACVGTPISAPRATPVTHATPITPRQTCRSKPPQPTFPGPWGFGPALAAGNTVVLKPAELTPLTAIRLGELALMAGLPEGVLTIVPGRGSIVGERFVTHPTVRKVCFTGSTGVGKRIMAGCADQVKRVTLELGGKSANIVFADADLAKAAAAAPSAVFDNAGQDCCARSRILVERSAYDEFVSLLEPAVQGVKVLDPSDRSSEMGPLISAAQKATVQGYVDDVEVAFSGSRPDGPGFWFAPTVVLTDDPSERIWRDEVFGPVVAVMPFDDEAQAVQLANDTEFGLSGSIFTRDVGRALRVSRAVEAGNLSINSHSAVRYWTPFGGFKQSGLGRELGPDAPHSFTEVKNVFISNE